MNDFLLGVCLSIYPGLRNTCAELPKVVCSSCFKILRIHFKITRKTQETAFQGFPISKFSQGEHAPGPPKIPRAFNARLSPSTSMPWRRQAFWDSAKFFRGPARLCRGPARLCSGPTRLSRDPARLGSWKFNQEYQLTQQLEFTIFD